MKTKIHGRQGGTKALTIATLLFVFSQPALGGIDDVDGDGVVDALDNCVQVSNPAQRDTDIDGYGNRCDPDFDNDQVVTFADLAQFKLGFLSSDDELDLDGDGGVNFADLAILKSYWLDPPGPGATDTDGDGVPLDQDRCPTSPAGGDALVDGCTAFDLAKNPERVGDTGAEGEEILAILQTMPELVAINDLALSALATVDASVARIRAGEVCEGVAQHSDGLTGLNRAGGALGSFILNYERQLADSPPFSHEDCDGPGAPDCDVGGDHTEADYLLVQYQTVASDLDRLNQRAEERGGWLSNTCSASTGPLSRSGTVLDVNESERTMTIRGLDTGEVTTIGLVDGASVEAEVYPGRVIQALGIAYGADAGLAGNIMPLNPERPRADLDYQNCNLLRIAPFQRFAPINTGPFELHDPDAYLYETGKLRLEKGMAIAVVNPFGCVDSNDDHTVRYSVSLSLQFRSDRTGQTETRALALTMDGSSQPVPLPEEIEHGSDATLTVNHKRQTCPLPTGSFYGESCSEQDIYRTDVFDLSVWDRETFCNVIYEETAFELENAGLTEFRSTFVSDRQTLLVVPDAGTEMQLLAEGFQVLGTGLSSYPSVTVIGEGQPFALFSHDCVTQDGLLYVEGSCGTNSASGLRWPRLTGVRNGHVFSYSCSLPAVVRDLRDYCPQDPDAFYKLPFFGSTPEWTISQGNDGAFTHNGNQSFAFDFVADAGEVIRAARAGTVAFVREDQTGNSFDDPGCNNCMANTVTIRHEDDTLADYLHLRTNGAYVSIGQTVERGQAIGEVGNTGFSTGPHLHFQARRSGLPTHPVRFESLDNGLGDPPSTCWIPESGDPLASDN